MAEMRRFEKLVVNSAPVAWYHRFIGVSRVLRGAGGPLQGPVLEVGCGNGATTREWVRRLAGHAVTAVDYDEDQVRRATARLGGSAQVQRGDVTNLAFPADHFGLVVEMNVLHHIPDPLRGLREVYRVLRPGGQFLFMDYAMRSYPSIFRTLFPPESVFTVAEFETALGNGGFDDIRTSGRRQFTGAARKPAPTLHAPTGAGNH